MGKKKKDDAQKGMNPLPGLLLLPAGLVLPGLAIVIAVAAYRRMSKD